MAEVGIPLDMAEVEENRPVIGTDSLGREIRAHDPIVVLPPKFSLRRNVAIYAAEDALDLSMLTTRSKIVEKLFGKRRVIALAGIDAEMFDEYFSVSLVGEPVPLPQMNGSIDTLPEVRIPVTSVKGDRILVYGWDEEGGGLRLLSEAQNGHMAETSEPLSSTHGETFPVDNATFATVIVSNGTAEKKSVAVQLATLRMKKAPKQEPELVEVPTRFETLADIVEEVNHNVPWSAEISSDGGRGFTEEDFTNTEDGSYILPLQVIIAQKRSDMPIVDRARALEPYPDGARGLYEAGVEPVDDMNVVYAAVRNYIYIVSLVRERDGTLPDTAVGRKEVVSKFLAEVEGEIHRRLKVLREREIDAFGYVLVPDIQDNFLQSTRIVSRDTLAMLDLLTGVADVEATVVPGDSASGYLIADVISRHAKTDLASRIASSSIHEAGHAIAVAIGHNTHEELLVAWLYDLPFGDVSGYNQQITRRYDGRGWVKFFIREKHGVHEFQRMVDELIALRSDDEEWRKEVMRSAIASAKYRQLYGTITQVESHTVPGFAQLYNNHIGLEAGEGMTFAERLFGCSDEDYWIYSQTMTEHRQGIAGEQQSDIPTSQDTEVLNLIAPVLELVGERVVNQ